MVSLLDVLKSKTQKNGNVPAAKNSAPQKQQGKGPVMVNKPQKRSAGRGR
jgi:hypothetical protein